MSHITWSHFHGAFSATQKQACLTALAAAGVSAAADESVVAEGLPGLVFFAEVNPSLSELLGELSRHGQRRVLAVAVSRTALTGGASWALLQAGAADVFAWNHSGAATSARAAAERLARWRLVDETLHSALVKNHLIGASPAWVRALRQAVEAARFTDAAVLLTGESGTGKELVARLIHTLDERADKGKLIVCDCTTIVPELSGSEFFGHERGAFTGAVAARDGAFALADGGTLFLDEVGELPLTLQAELLRVVQERTYKRVGGNTWQKTAFRLVCATNRDLPEEQRQGRFRADLYYRIAACTIHLPPLRERPADILPLARHFVAESRNGELLEFDNAVREYLLARAYPGNVRELKQLIARMMYRHVGAGPLTVGDLPEDERPTGAESFADWRGNGFEHSIRCALAAGKGLKEIGRAAEEAAEQLALAETEGNLQRAAALLGVTDRALQLRRASRRQNGAAAV